MELADGRGAWIPDGTAGVVVVLLISAFVLGMFAWGIWKTYVRGRR
ncbi:hypothetical protein OG349_09335 [Streptomyces sp. NBC_01317]|nr:hypothetical protein OG349_09335 [Streptomyces sp. NBC_01317]